MALANLIGKFLGSKGHGVDEVSLRLATPWETLRDVGPSYHEFTVPKRSGSPRKIAAPDPALKDLQRLILRRLLARLRSHPCATGFERGHSIVTNAIPHVNKAVVVTMDLIDFFEWTKEKRVREYFRSIGWNREAADWLTRICTFRGSLPQGAPTSPRLSNLVNYRMDARLDGLASSVGAVYTRYADNLTFSFEEDIGSAAKQVIGGSKKIVAEQGYRVHGGKRIRVRRRHQRQEVTGLVVNDHVNLPRSVRRRLRAVVHRLSNERGATLSSQQARGWLAYIDMINEQSKRT